MKADGQTARVSLILATIGRDNELQKLFASLRRQTYTNFEVIVVDQNSDDRVKRAIASAGQGLEIRHLRSEKGLSRARNLGLKFAEGEIVAFPDDDCWYPEELLERVVSAFEASPSLDGLTGRAATEGDKRQLVRFDGSEGMLGRYSVWRRAISYTIFLRTAVTRSVGNFDERLGVGAGTGLGSGEETDYLLRALAVGHEIHYLPSLQVYHVSFNGAYDRRFIVKGYGYSRGMGHVLRKHRYPSWFLIYVISRSLGGSLLGLARLNPGRACFNLAVAFGRASGWRSGGQKASHE